MNHTTNVNSVNKQLIEARSLYQLTSVPFILGETNSLYNEGAPGLSDSFGAALWALDFALYSAAGGIGRVHFHQGTNYRYQSWQPIDTNITTKGTKAPYYGNIAAAAFVGRAGSVVANVPLPGTTQAAYVVYRDDQLEKVMLINMLAFNTTGFGDGNQTRPAFDYQVHLPSCCEGTKVKLQRLMANGSDAISGVTFDGFSFNYELDGGKPVLMTNTTRGEEAVVQGGVVDVTVVASSAVMLVLDCDG
ncbi:hypothetical protein ANO11243_056080 [Dothideomycetidae sp. 11243]|nr:hypothetical protein ANO11243_056080 [fungal sp. No.11243]